MKSSIQSVNPLMNVGEIATMLGVSRKTVYHWVSRREVPFLKAGKHLRFDPMEVMEHFKNQTKMTPPCPSFQTLVESRHRSLKTRGISVAGQRSLQCQ